MPVPEIGKHMKCSACGSRDRLRRLITRLLGLGHYRDRVRLRESKKAAKSARRQKVLLEWQEQAEERARMRELRKKPCGAGHLDREDACQQSVIDRVRSRQQHRAPRACMSAI